jgi:phospholipid/cholesterol/gamma-HCH transport system substrate-binding protein
VKRRARNVVATIALTLIAGVAAGGCGWRGLNSLPLPGTVGGGDGSYSVQVQVPNATNLQQNARVRLGDVTVGNVAKIELQGWHALLTLRVSGTVHLPANANAMIGQTSLLGSLHVELAPPTGVAPQGTLHEGSVISLSTAGSYPTTEQTLSAVSALLNGGGLGQIQDITKAFGTALGGHEDDFRALIAQLDQFVGHLNSQIDAILAATQSLNTVVGQFAAQRPVLDKALTTIPNALAALKDQRVNLADVSARLARLGALTVDTVTKAKEPLIAEIHDLGPVLKSIADAGPALTRSLGTLATFPFPEDKIDAFQRGDYTNISVILDLTLSRLDASLLTGTRWEGSLTELEMRWGRTIGQKPSPYTRGNPLVVPYIEDQGP